MVEGDMKEEEVYMVTERNYIETTNSLISIVNETIPDMVKAIQGLGAKVNRIEQVLNNHHHDYEGGEDMCILTEEMSRLKAVIKKQDLRIMELERQIKNHKHHEHDGSMFMINDY